MRTIRIIADITVPDLEAGREFWSGFLGLDDQEFDLGWVTRHASPDTGAMVHLMTRDATAPENPLLSVQVEDVDAAYDEAVARGYEIVHPLTDEAWGVRRFFVRSPDGTVLNIVRHRE